MFTYAHRKLSALLIIASLVASTLPTVGFSNFVAKAFSPASEFNGQVVSVDEALQGYPWYDGQESEIEKSIQEAFPNVPVHGFRRNGDDFRFLIIPTSANPGDSGNFNVLELSGAIPGVNCSVLVETGGSAPSATPFDSDPASPSITREAGQSGQQTFNLTNTSNITMVGLEIFDPTGDLTVNPTGEDMIKPGLSAGFTITNGGSPSDTPGDSVIDLHITSAQFPDFVQTIPVGLTITPAPGDTSPPADTGTGFGDTGDTPPTDTGDRDTGTETPPADTGASDTSEDTDPKTDDKTDEPSDTGFPTDIDRGDDSGIDLDSDGTGTFTLPGEDVVPIHVDEPAVTFVDVKSTDWFAPYIQQLKDAKIMTGYKNPDGTPTGTVGPGNNVTRAELIAMIIRALALDGKTGNNPFNDINGHWAYNYILAAYLLGWIDGFSDGGFHPDEPVTRAQAAKIIALAFGLTLGDGSNVNFFDVSSTHWARIYLAALIAQQIIQGFPDGSFQPDAFINRAGVAKLIALTAAAMNIPLGAGPVAVGNLDDINNAIKKAKDDDCDEYKRLAAALKAQKDKLAADLKTAQDKALDAEAKADAAQDKADKLDQQVTDKQAEVTEAETELDDINDEMEQLDKEIADAIKATGAKVEQVDDDTKAPSGGAIILPGAFTFPLGPGEGLILPNQAAIDAFRAELAKKEAERKELIEKKAKANKKLKDLEKELKDLEDQKSDADIEASKAKADAAQAKLDLINVENDIADTNQAINDLNNKFKECIPPTLVAPFDTAAAKVANALEHALDALEEALDEALKLPPPAPADKTSQDKKDEADQGKKEVDEEIDDDKKVDRSLKVRKDYEDYINSRTCFDCIQAAREEHTAAQSRLDTQKDKDQIDDDFEVDAEGKLDFVTKTLYTEAKAGLDRANELLDEAETLRQAGKYRESLRKCKEAQDLIDAAEETITEIENL